MYGLRYPGQVSSLGSEKRVQWFLGDAKFTGVGVESHPWELCKHSWYPYDPGMGNFRSWPCGVLHLCFWPQPLSTSCLACKTRLAIACFLLTLIFWWILKIILYVYTLHRPLPFPTSLSPLATLHQLSGSGVCLFSFYDTPGLTKAICAAMGLELFTGVRWAHRRYIAKGSDRDTPFPRIYGQPIVQH